MGRLNKMQGTKGNLRKNTKQVDMYVKGSESINENQKKWKCSDRNGQTRR